MKNDKSEILEKLNSEDLKKYLKNIDINSIILFGSLINGDFNEESDVDIAVIGKTKLPIKVILKLELFLEDLLERNIDVVDLNSDNLDVFIKINILNTGKSIYSTDNDIILQEFTDKVDWYYRENEYYFNCRKRDLLS